MKKKILGIAFILLLMGAAVFYYTQKSPAAINPASFPFPLPDGAGDTNGQGAITLPLINDTTVGAKDFIHDGTTIPEDGVSGSYILAGQVRDCLIDNTCESNPDPTKFSISYEETYQSFTILLLKEPLGENRKEAEQLLMSKLGIPQELMCGLRYHLGTTYWVNESFAGRNLGFSFCQGAVKLP